MASFDWLVDRREQSLRSRGPQVTILLPAPNTRLPGLYLAQLTHPSSGDRGMGDQRSEPSTCKPSDTQPSTLTSDGNWDPSTPAENWDADVAELNSARSAAAGTPEDLPDVDVLAFFRDLPEDGGVLTNADDGETSSVYGYLDQLISSMDVDALKTEVTEPRLKNPQELGEDAREAGSQVAAPASSIAASGSDTENDLDQHTSVSSVASVSEFSDDGTSNRSSPVSVFLETPAAGPAAGGGACRPSDYPSGDSVSGVMGSVDPAKLHPCPPTGPSPTHKDLTCVSTQSGQSAVGSVTSGPRAPILPITFIPSFQYTPQVSVSSAGDTNTKAVPAIPTMGSLQATAAFAAASGAANQIFAAGLKRFRGGEGSPGPMDLKPAANEEPRRVLLSTTSAVEDGNRRAVGPGHEEDAVARKRTKREERLIKNREAANRSRLKVRSQTAKESRIRDSDEWMFESLETTSERMSLLASLSER